MNKEEALKLWDELYLEEEKAYDYASHPMKREDYENKDSLYGWTIDLKQPVLTAGKTAINNFIPSSIVTKNIRENKTSFKIGKFLFEVRKGKIYGQYDIYDITNKNEPLNMEPSDENQDPEYNRKRRETILGRKLPHIDLNENKIEEKTIVDENKIEENKEEKLQNINNEIEKENRYENIEDTERLIDEELKTLRLNEKIEEEGYKPTEEEIKIINEHESFFNSYEETEPEPILEEKSEEKDDSNFEFYEVINQELIKETIEEKEIEPPVYEKINDEQIVEEIQNKEEFEDIPNKNKVEEDIDDTAFDFYEVINSQSVIQEINEEKIDNKIEQKENNDSVEVISEKKEEKEAKSKEENNFIEEEIIEEINEKELLEEDKEKDCFDCVKIQDVKNENQKLLNKINDLNASNNNLVTANKEFIDENNRLKNELTNNLKTDNDNFEKLKDEVQTKINEINSKDNEIRNLSDSNSRLIEQNNLCKENESLKNIEIDNLKDEIEAYKCEIKNLEKQIDNTVNEKNKSDDKVESNEIIDAAKINLEDELNAYKEEKENLENKVKQLEDELNDLKERDQSKLKYDEEVDNKNHFQMSELEEENKSLNNKVKELELSNEKNKDKLEDISIIFLNLKDELLGYKEEKENLISENKKLLNEIENIKNKDNINVGNNDDLISENKKLKESNNKLIDDINNLKSANNNLVTANKEFVEEINNIKEDKNNLDDKLESNEEIENLQEEIKILENEIVDLKNKNQELERTKENLLMANKEFLKDNEKLKVNQTIVNKEIHVSDKEETILEDNIALVNTNRLLEKENKVLSDLKEKNEITINELRVALDEYLNKENVQENLENDNASKEAKINDLKRQLDEEKSRPVEKEIIEKIVYDDSAYLENLYIVNGGDNEKYEEFKELYKDIYKENDDKKIIDALRKNPEFIKRPVIINKVIPVDNSDVIKTNESLVEANRQFVEENKRLKESVKNKENALNDDYILTKNSLLKSVQDFLHENRKLKKKLEDFKVQNNNIVSLQDENDRLMEENNTIKEKVKDLEEIKNSIANQNESYKDSADKIEELENKNNELNNKYNSLLNDYSNLKKEMPIKDAEEEKAEEYFKLKFGQETVEAVDFAGNYIRSGYYSNHNSKFGYLYRLYDENKEDTLDNILVASIDSINNYKKDEPFTVNSKTFRVIYDDENKPSIVSDDYLADPNSFVNAISYAENTYNKTVSLIYVLIRFKGCDGNEMNINNEKIFLNLICSVTRNNYKKYLIDIRHEKHSLFITFDGTDKDSYEECLKYVTLINSYRRSFYQRGMIDAVIVLDKIYVPQMYVYNGFNSLLVTSKDFNMKAVQFELIQSEVVSSNIRTTVHIGSNIISDGLDLSNKNLHNSNLISNEFINIQGEDYIDTDKNYFVEYRYLLWKD